ncbi:MAG: hypothetical protein H7Z17_14670 [Fuerstia sp.]|nr:hypothetical protein [Fuerstiella sp.]
MHSSALSGRSKLPPQLPKASRSNADASHGDSVSPFVIEVDVRAPRKWMCVRNVRL